MNKFKRDQNLLLLHVVATTFCNLTSVVENRRNAYAAQNIVVQITQSESQALQFINWQTLKALVECLSCLKDTHLSLTSLIGNDSVKNGTGGSLTSRCQRSSLKSNSYLDGTMSNQNELLQIRISDSSRDDGSRLQIAIGIRDSSIRSRLWLLGGIKTKAVLTLGNHESESWHLEVAVSADQRTQTVDESSLLMTRN